jgi:lipopolysaccharide assembly outer membrane protein LptD (OstA)
LAAPNDEASRVNLGVSHGLLHSRGVETDLFIGQSFNLSDSDYSLASGYGDSSSAYVVQGNLAYQTADAKMALTQNLRIDPSDNSTLRNQVNASYQRAGFSANVDYSFFAAGQTAAESKKEQTVTMNWPMNDYWQVGALNRRDLRNDRDVLSSLDFVYEDICTLVRVSFSRDYAEIDNIEPETSIGITFVLKTLGGTE